MPDLKKHKKKYIVLAASGSGGHLFPAFVLGMEEKERLSKKNIQANLVLITGDQALDKNLAQNKKIFSETFHCKLAKRTGLVSHIALCAQILFLFCKFFIKFLWSRPELVITTGGVISIPVIYAARLLRIPVNAYELNATFGLATTAAIPLLPYFYSPFSYEHAKWRPCHYPVRLEHLPSGAQAPTNKKKFTLFIQGGSQGSRSLNRIMCNAFEAYLTNKNYFDKKIFIIHQVGAQDDLESIRRFYKEHGLDACVFSFKLILRSYYEQADCIISRAGAGSIFEALLWKKTTILIPLITKTTDHQKENAQKIASSYPELFIALEQQLLEVEPERLLALIKTISHQQRALHQKVTHKRYFESCNN